MTGYTKMPQRLWTPMHSVVYVKLRTRIWEINKWYAELSSMSNGCNATGACAALQDLCDYIHSKIMMTSSNGNIFALLAICAGNSPVTGEFPVQRLVTRSFDVFFDLRLDIRLSKQSWDWWFETLSCPLWRQCNVSMKWTPFLRHVDLHLPNYRSRNMR